MQIYTVLQKDGIGGEALLHLNVFLLLSAVLGQDAAVFGPFGFIIIIIIINA